MGCDADNKRADTKLKISIHAPTWGATEHSDLRTLTSLISIHAPTWGATPLHCQQKRTPPFQSTHPRGVRLNTVEEAEEYILFQSTHPRGVRPRLEDCENGIPEFQSTHPRGVRHETTEGYPYKQIFQSTHPRGVRQAMERKTDQEIKFQSTHPRGVRLKFTGALSLILIISIHAPTWGATWT